MCRQGDISASSNTAARILALVSCSAMILAPFSRSLVLSPAAVIAAVARQVQRCAEQSLFESQNNSESPKESAASSQPQRGDGEC